MNVTVVTVTYGKRAHLLTQVLDAAREQGVVEAVVIDNGSADPVAEILAERYGAWAFVHAMGGNTGSALGFKTGIEQALARGAEFLLLLDDDNRMAPDCVENLCRAYCELSRGLPLNKLAVHAARIGAGTFEDDERYFQKIVQVRAGAYLQFHIADLPKKIINRLVPSGPFSFSYFKKEHASSLQVVCASYGGLFFHVDVAKTCGMPDEKFVLYVDDYEFTYRFTSEGGKIFLLKSAKTFDVDAKWTDEIKTSSHSISKLYSARRFELYYTTRNVRYFERHVQKGAPFGISFINRVIYLTILRIVAKYAGQSSNFDLILKAASDGEGKKLGFNPDFPIVPNSQNQDDILNLATEAVDSVR